MRANLKVLYRSHPYFKELRQKNLIDFTALGSLPENGTIYHRLRTVKTQVQSEGDSGEHGPDSAAGEDVAETEKIVSDGFVPSIDSTEREAISLVNLLQPQEDEQVILTQPAICSTPINEHDKTIQYIILAFPTVFPTGQADLNQPRDRSVTPEQYFRYLMRYKDGRVCTSSSLSILCIKFYYAMAS
jgi:ATP-dependent DNA helicase PIF1